MGSFFRRWRWRHLFVAWAGYWVGLALVTLWRPVSTLWRLRNLGEDRGSVTAQLSNTIFSLEMFEGDVRVWSGSASLLTMVLWIAGPPLVLWIAWVIGRPRPATAPAPAPSLGHQADRPAPAALPEGGMSFADQLREARPRDERVGIPRHGDRS